MIHKILKHERLTPTTLMLEITRESVIFQPGSCIYFEYGDVLRPYSIASGVDENCLRFYIRLFPNGKMSKYFLTLKRDDNIITRDVFTYFEPGKNGDNGSYCYIATGTGIAPFLSALKTYKHKPQIILYGARGFYDLVEFLYLRNNNHCIFSVSRDTENAEKFKINKGRVTDYLRYIPISPEMKLNNGMKYYLCGINTMIDDVSSYLMDNGILCKNIYQEQFYQKQD